MALGLFWHCFEVTLVSFRVALGLLMASFGIALGSLWLRFEVVLSFLWLLLGKLASDCSGLALPSFWGALASSGFVLGLLWAFSPLFQSTLGSL